MIWIKEYKCYQINIFMLNILDTFFSEAWFKRCFFIPDVYIFPKDMNPEVLKNTPGNFRENICDRMYL